MENICQQKNFYVEKNNINYRLSYLEWGNTNNPKVLFCVHGLTRNSRDFDYIANSLSNDYRIISLDVVGRGNSDWVNDKSVYNYDNYAEDVILLTDHLKLTKIDYLGTSMGGLISMIVSSLRPNLINNLILNDIGPFIPPDALAKLAKYVSVYPKFNNLKHAEEYLRIKLAHFGIRKPKDWEYITMNSVKLDSNSDLILAYHPLIVNANSDKRIYYPNGNFKSFDFWKTWHKSNFNNGLVIRGSYSEILPIDVTEKMINSKKNIDVIEIQDVGHAPALMEENQINIVKNWLLDKN